MKSICVVVCGVAVILALTGRAADKDPGAVTADQRKQAVDKLNQIGLGLQNYHDTFMHLPRAFVGKDGTPLLSWRVAILPYIGEGPLFVKFKANEPWDSESNKKLIEKMPKIFESV